MVNLANLEQAVLESPEVKAALLNIEDGKTRKKAAAAAEDYLRKIKPNKTPEVIAISKWLSSVYVSYPFSNVIVSGLEKVIGEMRSGGVALFSSHFSLLELAVIFDLFAKQNLDNVYYVGGINLASTPIIGPMLIDPLLRNSGVVLIEREAEYERKLKLLLGAVVEATMGYLFDAGNNVVSFIGDGRHKNGKVGHLKSAVARSALNHARMVATSGETYDIVPEGKDFAAKYIKMKALAGAATDVKAAADAEEELLDGAELKSPGKKGRGSTLFDGFGRFRVDGGYGTAYVAFGYPTQMGQHYTGEEISSRQLRSFRNEIRAGVLRNITVTPVNLLSATLVAKGVNLRELTFTPKQVAELAEAPLAEAYDAGAHVSGRLKQDLDAAFYFAASKLAETGALEITSTSSDAPNTAFKIREPWQQQFYANTITQTLELFGVKI